MLYQPKHKLLKGALSPGDILRIPLTGYNHYAIYVGDGMYVHRIIRCLHDKEPNVTLNHLRHLPQHIDVFQCNFLDHSHSVLPQEEIVRRAISRLGNHGFDLLDCNCEHLVTWCRYGQDVSLQRNRMVAGWLVTILLVTAMLGSLASCGHHPASGLLAFLFFLRLQILVLVKTFPDLTMQMEVSVTDCVKSVVAQSCLPLERIKTNAQKFLDLLPR